MWYGGGLGYGKGVGIPSRAVSVVRQGSADTLTATASLRPRIRVKQLERQIKGN